MLKKTMKYYLSLYNTDSNEAFLEAALSLRK